MRLTLRTLLAYLDNVLEPADAEELRKRIEESEFAAGLVSRIRNVIGKARMNAPKVDAKGLAEDANNVADYLDSTLTPERVGDFERYCLEGDVHLAEVAACHHVLTLVLGKPAEVSPALRQRIYDLPTTPQPTVAPISAEERLASSATVSTASDATSDGQVAASSGATVANGEISSVSAKSGSALSDNGVAAKAVPASAAAVSPAIPAAEVPDYLRASGPRRSVWPVVIVALAALVLLAVGLRAMGPFDSTHPLLGGGTPVAEVPENPTEVPASGDPATDPAGDPADGNMTEGPTGEGDPAGEVPPVELPQNPENPAVVEVDPMPGDPGVGTPAANAGQGDTIPAIPGAPPVGAPGNPANPGDPAEMPVESVDPVVVIGPDGLPLSNNPLIEQPTEPAAPPVATDGDQGRFLSDTQLLARQDRETGLWYRVRPRAVLRVEDRLVALPTYRPQVALASGVQLTFAGEGSALLLAPKAPGESRVAIQYGRFLAVTNGAMGAKFDIVTATTQGVLTLSDADATASIEVRPYLPPGTDPEVGPVFMVVDIFAGSGRVVWQAEGGKPVEIAPHFVLSDIGTGESQMGGPFETPAWVDAASMTELDRLNATQLESLLPADKPLDVSLKELAQHRRTEVQSLAGRSLASLNSFESVLQMLGDERHHSFWAVEVESLRQALARSKDSSILLRQAIEAADPANAAEIDRLLWGFSREQLASGDAARMVKSLESDSMVVRVITLDNLRTITGAMHLYMPQKKADGNKLAIQKWKERLESGAIDYRVPPTALYPYQPLKGAAGKPAPAVP